MLANSPSNVARRSATLRRRFTRSKSDLNGYAQSKFIKRVSGKGVDFALDNRPFFITAVYLPYYLERTEMEDVGKDVPLSHVEWIAYYLNQLSQSQLLTAFRAAGYSPEEAATFAAVTKKRIGELGTIREGGPNRAERSERAQK
jgi:hypothetical protein